MECDHENPSREFSQLFQPNPLTGSNVQAGRNYGGEYVNNIACVAAEIANRHEAKMKYIHSGPSVCLPNH